MTWRPFDTAPKAGAFLVWLPEEMLGTNIHVMKRLGKSAIIGGYFDYDAPCKPTHWMPLPDAPEEDAQ